LCCLCIGFVVLDLNGQDFFNVRGFRGVRRNRINSGDDILKKLKKITYTKLLFDVEDTLECVICLNEFKDGDDVIQLKCSKKHIFHVDCLSEWIKSDHNMHGCPMCRAKI
jgi:hypothetical protein